MSSVAETTSGEAPLTLGAGGMLVPLLPSARVDLQSAAQLVGVSGPSHTPSPQHFVCPAAHGATDCVPLPPAPAPPGGTCAPGRGVRPVPVHMWQACAQSQ